MNDSPELIRFVGNLIFDPEYCPWDELSGEAQLDFCRLAEPENFDMLLVRQLGKRIPEEYYAKFRHKYKQLFCYQQIIERGNLERLYKLFEAEQIPFTPLKGVDLAYRVYPDPVLRPYSDWDILIPREDCPRALKLLCANGWRTGSGCVPDDPRAYHYEALLKEKQMLEVHWTLPNFGNATPAEIWGETREFSGCHRVFTPEMNLVHVAAHASAGYYSYINVWKVLKDAAAILQHDAVDWDKVHHLADHWGILRPDILLAAWSEFFPDGVLPAGSLIPAHQKLIREVAAMRNEIEAVPSGEKLLNSTPKYDLKFFRERLKFYANPSRICQQYHLPPNAYVKIIGYGMYNFWGKLTFFILHARDKNPTLQKVKQIEALICPEKH